MIVNVACAVPLMQIVATNTLVAQMNKLIVELGVAENTDSDAPIPPPESIAHSTATTGDTASIYTSGDGVGVLGGEDGH